MWGKRKREEQERPLPKWVKREAVNLKKIPRREKWEPVVKKEVLLPQLPPPDSGRGAAAAAAAASTLRETAAFTSSERWRGCDHHRLSKAHLDLMLSMIRRAKHSAICELCRGETNKEAARKGQRGRSSILMCLHCSKHCCTLRGHARQHAEKEMHCLAAPCSAPYAPFCFECLKEASPILAAKCKGHSSGPADGQGKYVRGIPNRGRTCYMNALVQCLFVLKNMRSWMLGHNAPTSNIGKALKKLFVAISSPGSQLNPDELLSVIHSAHPELEGNNNQDSHELLCHLRSDLREGDPTFIDSIFGGEHFIIQSCDSCSSERVLNHADAVFWELSVPVPSPKHPVKGVSSALRTTSSKPQKAILHNFNPATEKRQLGRLQTVADSHTSGSELGRVFMDKTSEPWEADCTEDEQVSQMNESNSIVSIEDCLKLYFEKTVQSKSCKKCSKVAERSRKQVQVKRHGNGIVTETHVISKLPPVLTLHLKRYTTELHKMTAHVSFSEILDVGQFVDPSSKDKDNSLYRLVGLVEHRGAATSLDEGHFVAYVRAGRTWSGHQSSNSSLWFCASDDTVEEISISEILKREAYILFYEQITG
ncbi:hypothetical protein ACP4OV_021686 [Aristida adscensionis]